MTTDLRELRRYHEKRIPLEMTDFDTSLNLNAYRIYRRGRRITAGAQVFTTHLFFSHYDRPSTIPIIGNIFGKGPTAKEDLQSVFRDLAETKNLNYFYIGGSLNYLKALNEILEPFPALSSIEQGIYFRFPEGEKQADDIDLFGSIMNF